MGGRATTASSASPELLLPPLLSEAEGSSEAWPGVLEDQHCSPVSETLRLSGCSSLVQPSSESTSWPAHWQSFFRSEAEGSPEAALPAMLN